MWTRMETEKSSYNETNDRWMLGVGFGIEDAEK